MRERTGPAVPYQTAVVEDLLELLSRRRALTIREIALPAAVGGIETAQVRRVGDLAVFDGRGRSLQIADGLVSRLASESELRPDRRQPQRLDLRIHGEALVQLLGDGVRVG